MTICSTCNRDFDLEAEGGIEGHFGMIPVCFCPECKACVYDMGQQLVESDELENYRELLKVARCPNRSCTDGYVQSQDPVQDCLAAFFVEQCQWCAEREEAIKDE